MIADAFGASEIRTFVRVATMMSPTKSPEKMPMACIVGLDVSLRGTAACVVDTSGTVVREFGVAIHPDDLAGSLAPKNPDFDGVYNAKRLHTPLDHLSPDQVAQTTPDPVKTRGLARPIVTVHSKPGSILRRHKHRHRWPNRQPGPPVLSGRRREVPNQLGWRIRHVDLRRTFWSGAISW